MFKTNIEFLKSFDPVAARSIEEAVPIQQFKIATSQTGDPIPEVRGIPLHSPISPREEARQVLAHIATNGEICQKRICLFGFGFGYIAEALVAKGLSPIVYEPQAYVIRAAFSTRDLRHVLPHCTFRIGPRRVDIPQSTIHVLLSAYAQAFPFEAQDFSSSVPGPLPECDPWERGARASAYRNVTCLKSPADLAIYQMLVHLVRPTLILEIGALRGGSALFFADLLRQLGGERRVYTFDINDQLAPEVFHDPFVVPKVHDGWKAFDPGIIAPNDRVLVIEDSAHTYENSIQVLEHFAPYVTPNSYLIVEDGAAGLTRPEFNGGAIRAIEEFLPAHPEFEVDAYWESFFGAEHSSCLKGFLRRKVQL